MNGRREYPETPLCFRLCVNGQKNENWDNAITKDDLEIELVKTITIEGIFKKLKIDKIDFLRDTAQVKIYYN